MTNYSAVLPSGRKTSKSSARTLTHAVAIRRSATSMRERFVNEAMLYQDASDRAHAAGDVESALIWTSHADEAIRKAAEAADGPWTVSRWCGSLKNAVIFAKSELIDGWHIEILDVTTK